MEKIAAKGTKNNTLMDVESRTAMEDGFMVNNDAVRHSEALAEESQGMISNVGRIYQSDINSTKKFFAKALSIAAIAGLALGGSAAQADDLSLRGVEQISNVAIEYNLNNPEPKSASLDTIQNYTLQTGEDDKTFVGGGKLTGAGVNNNSSRPVGERVRERGTLTKATGAMDSSGKILRSNDKSSALFRAKRGISEDLSGVISKFYPLNDGIMTGAAAELTPTLDTMKSGATTILPSASTYFGTTYALTELTSGTAPEGTTTISFNGKTYYYTTPTTLTSEKVNMLNYLSGSTAVALTTTGATSANAVFSIGGTNYTFDTTKLPISAYTLTETVTPAHWGITLPTWNETTQAYENKTYDLEMRDQGSGDQNIYFKWSVNSDGKNRKLTHDGATSSANDLVVKANTGTGGSANYYKWTKDSQNNWQLTKSGASSTSYDVAARHDATSHTRIKSGSGEDVTGDFFDLNGQSKGSAIYLSGSGQSLGNVVGDFVGNYASSSSSDASGGAIYNYYYSTISSIVGDFVGNYASGKYANGGAIYNNSHGTISSIVGDFVGNYASGSSSSSDANGGAISNKENSTISSIVGRFCG